MTNYYMKNVQCDYWLDILECKVKWALGSITMKKASGGDGIPAELFQILKDDTVKLKVKWKWKLLSCVRLFVIQGLYSPGNSPGQNTGVGSLSLLQGIFPIRDWTQVSRIGGGFFTSWATKKSKNTGVGSLSLLQWIFPIQEPNWGLLHYRWIFCQLSYQWS